MQHKQRSLALITLPLAIVTTLCVGASINSAKAQEAQIVPDSTLGAESSVVTPDVEINGIPSDQIDGGATRGANLFHSFQEFNVGEGQGAYFSNPAAIENILSRVTGSNLSNILGNLGVLGDANLFFINPNGIVFGPNARLDVGGSFVGSTADSLVFENGFEFGVTNPEAPPLLTINIPLGLRFRESSETLVNQSIATNNMNESVGLQVRPERTLALVGGDVAIESGGLTAPDGQIELGSVAGNNLVSLTPTDTGYALGYEGIENFQDIRLSQGAFVNTSGNGGGRIQVQGSNVTLSDESFMFANTQGSGNGGGVSLRASQLTVRDGSRISASTSTDSEGAGGNLVVDVDESVQLIGSSADGRVPGGLFAEILGAGDGGDLTINTGQLTVRDGARINASTSTDSEGAGGNLVVDVDESVQLIGSSADGLVASGLFADTVGAGAGGDLTISTGQLIVRDGARINASTFGAGDGGDLTISTGQLIVRDGARINASTSTDSEGDGGNLVVDASESVQLIGRSADGLVASGLFAEILGAGDVGDLAISTGQLIVADGAEVSTGNFSSREGDGGNLVVKASESVQLIAGSRLLTQTLGAGNAGDLTIETGQLIVADGAEINAGISFGVGDGDGGNLMVKTSESVQVIGRSADGQFPSRLSTQTLGAGNAGDLIIETGQLIVQDGAEISAASEGAGESFFIMGDGDGGNLVVKASESVQLIAGSRLLTQTLGAGNAGDLTISTPELLVRDGALVSAATSGGEGGSITVTANTFEATEGGQLRTTTTKGSQPAGDITLMVLDSITLAGDNSGLFANTEDGSSGNGGSISIDPRILLIQDGARIAVDSQGGGKGGKIEIFSDSLNLDNQAEISAETQSTDGGDIKLEIDDALQLRGKSKISATAGIAEDFGDGGNINIDADFIVAFPRDNQIIANAFEGTGGNIDINTKFIFGFPNFLEIDASSELGLSGMVEISNLQEDPSSRLIELPEDVVDPAALIALNPCSLGLDSEFVIIGRGGLPPSPSQVLGIDSPRVGLVEPTSNASTGERSQRNKSETSPSQNPQSTNQNSIVPARGWIYNEKGEAVLVGYDPTKSGVQRPRSTPASCPVF